MIRFVRSGPSPRKRGNWRQPLAIVGAAIGITWVVASLLAPLLAPYGPLESVTQPLQAPSGEHIFGTDELGRDIFSRVLFGARRSILPGMLIVLISTVVGGTAGAIAGYLGGWVEEVVMRIADLVFAFPTIVLAMAIVAILGPSLENGVIALVLARWPPYARVVRSLIISLKDLDYVHSSRLLGMSTLRVLRVDVAPNMLGPVVVLAALEIGQAILILAGLSFLGLGTPPPAPDWGRMVAEGTRLLASWWMGTFPGLAIFSAVIAFNLLGDSMRDALDPKISKSVETREA